MARGRFWGRVGRLFRSGGRTGPSGGDLPPVARDGLLQDDAAHSAGGGDGRPAGPLSRRRQREQALETLQEAYLQVVGLIGLIHKHLETQDRRTQAIADALGRLAETTSRLPEAAEAQTEKLGAIAAQIETGNDQARRWEQTLFELPKLADAQREALTAIGRELEAAQQTDGQMAETLDGLRAALTSWGESSVASTEAIKDLQATAARRDERLDTLMTAQNKRFTWFFVTMAVLALAAIGAGIIAMLK